MSSRYPIAWLRRMRRLQDNGYINPPPLFNYINNLPKLTELKPSPRKTISYEEDQYLQAIYARYPEIKHEPIELNSFAPSLARRFAWRQIEFIKEGYSTNEALYKAEEYFREEITQTKENMKTTKSSIGIVQEEEERVLHRALRQEREKKERQLKSSVLS